ncbi:ABC transporter ATP-binding protein [Arthrobacter sp. SX1312]|uniref:dipeptide ABC transporter ATP-binding protein n=1 Tax=Arthrobacter sp. SX1312 TaxID=2058896 RepID=UPI000CE387E0|nr:ABC transporter ATP-binding protein [Arthrobacter sp. SX1312]
MSPTALTTPAGSTPTTAADTPVVELEGLSVAFGRGIHRREIIHDLSLSIRPGECLALVGESGSGKSVTARTLVGLTGPGADVRSRAQRFRGRDASAWGERQWTRVRGKEAGFILQDALSSLDALRTVGDEVGEVLRLHGDLDRGARRQRVVGLLASVGVPDPEVRAGQYPHELSGGLRQRALIASAIAADPGFLIADEPTTALDATIAAQVLRLLGDLKGGSTAMLVVSHDLAVVADLADRVAVMRDGVIVEEGSVQAVLEDPRHPYTQGLLAAIPSRSSRGRRLTVVGSDQGHGHARSQPDGGQGIAAPREAPTPGRPSLTVEGITKAFGGPGRGRRTAVDGVSFTLHRGTTLGIVGESGSGKSTVARIALGVEAPDAGTVHVRGRTWGEHRASRDLVARRSVQMIYQDPLQSFDPRKTVRQVIGQAAAAAGTPRTARAGRVLELLDLVGLPADRARARPLDLSGGQRQRVAIARALAAEPEVIICDEPVSALDITVQARILDLLTDLQDRFGLSYLFISHDLGVIQHISREVLVLKDGVVLEHGPVAEVFDQPGHEYTRHLINAIPELPAVRKDLFRP